MRQRLMARQRSVIWAVRDAQLSQTTAAPLVGNVAPDFTAQAVFDQEFQEISLSSYRGKYVSVCSLRPPSLRACYLRAMCSAVEFLTEVLCCRYVILFFYPLDFTFVCPTGAVPTLGA